MKNLEAISYKDKLDDLFKKASVLSGDLSLQSHWARYLCVLVSGFLEVAVGAIYTEFAQKHSDKSITNYVSNNLERFTNPNMEKIIGLTSTFEKTWGESLRDKTKGKLKDSVDSICANRNRIAHGENAGVTYVQIYNWYQDAVKVIEILENICI